MHNTSHYTLVRKAKIKNSDGLKWEDAQKADHSCFACGM